MNINKLHFVYLFPSDMPTSVPDNTPKAIATAAAHMATWCQWQMGNNKTFTWDFHAYQTTHPAMWYSTFTEEPTAPHSEWYWANAQRDARDFAGARFYMEHDSWVVYVNAPIADDQHAGGASVNGSGICVLHQKDCIAIRGQDPQWSLCRAVGGGLHELLHTLGVPHPEAGHDWERAVMGIGYMRYPDAILTANDKVLLDHNRFFAVEPRRPAPNICRFMERRQPRPRPYPLPVVRPVRMADA